MCSLKEVIKAEAEKLGFCFSGFTRPQTPEAYIRYRVWLEKEQYGSMRFLAREDHLQKRAAPELILSGLKTICVLGVPINLFHPEEEGIFSVASFAKYYDYHDQISVMAEKLMTKSIEVSGQEFRYKVCVDSAPLLERGLAVQAGLGWIGKNSMFIHPRYGSAVLLCECLMDQAMEVDAPFTRDYCGSCLLCSEACPAHCIDIESRTICAKECISYLTIENKEEFSKEQAKMIDCSVFGCDRCVASCPWNRRNASIVSPLVIHPAKAEISDLELGEDEFKMKYAGSPILRAKLAGWRRNLRNVLENN